MPDRKPPTAVQRLIDGFVASMDHVELLVQLHAGPNRRYTVDDLVAGGHIDRRSVVRALDDFESAGIVRNVDGVYRYAPSAGDLSAIGALSEMYRTRPITLIRAVYSRPSPLNGYGNVLGPR